MAPLSSDAVAQLLRSYRELAKERTDLEAILVRLASAWAELRKLLNELNAILRDQGFSRKHSSVIGLRQRVRSRR